MLVAASPSVISMAHPTQNLPFNFQTFFNGWLIRHQNLFHQLLLAITPENFHNNEQHQSLIDQVLSHYQQYYEEKSVAAREDLLNSSVKDLTAEQEHGMEQLEAETRREERELSETMARLQERVAAPPLFNLARRYVNMVDGEVSAAEAAMKELQTGILMVIETADELRATTMRKIMQITSQIQTVKLFAAAAQFHLGVRSRGLQRDKQTRNSLSGSC